jgi:hypothetical protein
MIKKLQKWPRPNKRLSRIDRQSHIATDGQSVCLSWCRAPAGAHDQMFLLVWKLLSCPRGEPSLTRGRVCHLSVIVLVSMYKYLQVYNCYVILCIKAESNEPNWLLGVSELCRPTSIAKHAKSKRLQGEEMKTHTEMRWRNLLRSVYSKDWRTVIIQIEHSEIGCKN